MRLVYSFSVVAMAKGMIWATTEEIAVHNIDDLIDTAEYALSVLRKVEIYKHIQ